MGLLGHRRGHVPGPAVESTLDGQSPDGGAFRWLGDLDQDVRYAIRTMRRALSFAMVAVLTLALGIGAATALGAQRAQVLALVLRTGVILTTIGIALGLVGAAASTRFLQGMLFGITPLDPKTFMAVSLMFGLVATLASYVPARRATKVDPMVALRSE